MASPRYFYGALPDTPDPRDWRKKYAEVPCKGGQCSCEVKCSLVDLRQHKCKASSQAVSESAPSLTPGQSVKALVPEVYNQGQLGSCTANAVASAYRIDLRRQGLRDFPPSRLFLYYNSRKCDGDTKKDSGASLRCTMKAINREGVCPEIELRMCDGSQALPYWEYATSKFKQEPPKKCYDEAQKNKACKYERLDQDIDQFRACLKEGFPFVFGFKVPPNFIKEASLKLTSNMKIPAPEEMKEEGLDGHAVVAVGYDDKRNTITVLNSWGVHWGDNGYFYMPYKFIEEKDYCYDFWKIEVVSEDTDIDCKGQAQKAQSYKAGKNEDSHRTGTKAGAFPPQTAQSKCCGIL